ncbi:MAG: DUF3566 domain-containing protein [Acidimicrobiales bacterium]|nr:DUF3566 domain-containing protein [Acidimicrobiales bacterium]
MADPDQPDEKYPLTDGVDDETFARAVGLDNENEGSRSHRRRKITGLSKRSDGKEERRRARERTVVRRPPAVSKSPEQTEPPPVDDVTGVVPIIETVEPPMMDAPTIEAVEPQPALPDVALPTGRIGIPENDLGWLSRRRARVKRTRRTLRHIDPWSVLKVSVLLYACLYGATVLAGYLLWVAAVQSGIITNIESFIAEVGSYEVWEINGDEVFRRATVIGAVLFVAGVALNVVLTIIFNLISDLVGGVRVTLLEEDQPPSEMQ